MYYVYKYNIPIIHLNICMIKPRIKNHYFELWNNNGIPQALILSGFDRFRSL